MNPTLCTVVILHQIQPYIIKQQQEENEEEDYHQLFRSYYGQVYIENESPKAINKVKQCSLEQPTLLLLDLDAVENDNTQFISNITRDLNCLPNYVPLVVCSMNDDTNIMLNSIQAGATDYLLKPIYLNVIKTLFLKFHTYQTTKKTSCLPVICTKLNERVNAMTQKDIHITNTIMKIYASPIITTNRTIEFYTTHISKKRSSELKSKVCSWDFSPFGLNEQELIHCVYLVFDQVLKLPELYHISLSQVQLYEFIIDLASVYHTENPYHNFAHAVDVLQCLFYMLCELGVLPFTNKFQQQKNKPQALLRPKDVFALLMAAIGHDAAHPGVNNLFLINSANPLATLYNDRSILESLHSMTLFHLLNKHGIDKLVGEPKSDAYKEFRKIVVSSILATDMSLHLDYVCKIKEQATRFASGTQKEQEEERILLCSALIKCADISNVARPFHWGTKWAELLVKEFISQGDLEKELGMPVLPMNDRNHVVLEDTQIGFIQFVALDLFQNVRQVLSEISFAVDQMQSNLKQWQLLKKNASYEQDSEDDFEIISNSSTTQMMMVDTGHKRASTSSDEHSVKKKISLEKYHTHDSSTTEVKKDHNSDVANNPVYCQCSIQ